LAVDRNTHRLNLSRSHAGSFLLVLALTFALAGCSPPTPPKQADTLHLVPVEFADLPGWQADDVAAALPALRRSCAALTKAEDDKPVGPAHVGGTVADWRAACLGANNIPDGNTAAARHFFETSFSAVRAENGKNPDGLFTGYYEMALRGQRTPDATFAYPLYRRPEDLITVDLGDFRADWKGQRIAGKIVSGKLKPYAPRADIAGPDLTGGVLKGRNLEILWVDDPVDAFFLEIQGSGRVTLPDGSVVRLGYDAANGYPYTAIGRDLIARGELTRETVSMQTIRAWLTSHPDQRVSELALNQSYVFFRELHGDGPIGAEGVALTPGRSLAVDPGFMPLGVPLWLDLDDAALGRIRRLVVAQDTGGAITGPVRGDLFWGFGPDAADHAGSMKAKGGYYLLLPRVVVERMRVSG
jgi:membrane-bound lytic murein transglycosylase A